MTIRREELDQGRVDLSDVIDADADPLPEVTPGDILMSEWMHPLGLSAYRLAKELNVPASRVSEILAGNRAITAETALRLARYFGTDAQSWLNLQNAHDMSRARRELGGRIESEVKPRAA